MGIAGGESGGSARLLGVGLSDKDCVESSGGDVAG